MFKQPFKFEGRIRRLEFGLSIIICYFSMVIITLIGFLVNLSNLFILIFEIPAYWFLFAQGAKRCHDFGKNGWWQLIPFYIFWLIFNEGVPGENEYGSNPKGIICVNGQLIQQDNS